MYTVTFVDGAWAMMKDDGIMYKMATGTKLLIQILLGYLGEKYDYS